MSASEDIVLTPDPRLSEMCAPIEKIDDEVRALAQDMLDVMYDIPKSKEPRKVIITKACINEGEKPEVIALDK